MVVVTVAVVRSGRAFSGVVVARVVGDVGGRHDGASRPFGNHIVMIAHTHVSGRLAQWGLSFNDRWRCLQLMRAARVVHGSMAPPDL
jgi:hypothetical protein